MESKLDIDSDGTERWGSADGLLHRLDGPALIFPNGDAHWFKNGQLHRLDGPAVVYRSGCEEWWVHGERHRENGPAVIGLLTIQWWINGVERQIVEVKPNLIFIRRSVEDIIYNICPSIRQRSENLYHISDEDLCILRLHHNIMRAY